MREHSFSFSSLAEKSYVWRILHSIILKLLSIFFEVYSHRLWFPLSEQEWFYVDLSQAHYIHSPHFKEFLHCLQKIVMLTTYLIDDFFMSVKRKRIFSCSAIGRNCFNSTDIWITSKSKALFFISWVVSLSQVVLWYEQNYSHRQMSMIYRYWMNSMFTCSDCINDESSSPIELSH